MNYKEINRLLTYAILSIFIAVAVVLTISILVGHNLLTPHQPETLVLAGIIFIWIIIDERKIQREESENS